MSAEPKRLTDDPDVPDDLRAALEAETRKAPSYDVNQGWERLSTTTAGRVVATADAPPAPPPSLVRGRYTLYGELGAGGMATVHYARMAGAGGFGRTVAVKRLHPQLSRESEFVAMFLDEARLAARVKHPNVVQTLDVVAEGQELFVVMEYVHGEPLSRLIRASAARNERVPARIVASIMAGVLHGLHAAHEAKSERGEPLKIVHRDVSPQNILVGADGVARVLDFGVAKAVGRLHTTREGRLKGKLAYMPPEQLAGEPMTRLADVYAASVVTWEALTLQRLFVGESEAATVTRILHAKVLPPSAIAPEVPPELDRIVLRGMSRDPSERFASAREMALALEGVAALAPASEVAAWVERVASAELHERAEVIAAIERAGSMASDPSATLSEIVTPGARPSRATTLVDVPISTSRPKRAPPRALLLTGLVLLIGAVGVAFILGGRASPHPEGDARAAASMSAEPVVSAIASPPASGTSAVSSTAAPTASASVIPTSTASAHAATSSHLVPRPSASASAPSGSPSVATSVTPPTNPCDPPYTTDANGHRHYKPECFPH